MQKTNIHKILKSKKGFSFNTLMWLLRIGMMLLGIFSALLVINIFIADKVDLRAVEAGVISNRIIYSKEGISYVDPASGRVYPGIIDYTVMQKDNILNESIYMKNNDYVGARIALFGLDGKEMRTTYYNKEWYDILRPKSFVPGFGASKIFKDRRYVLVKKPGISTLVPAILEIEVITANS